jgi:hypothetical protein
MREIVNLLRPFRDAILQGQGGSSRSLAQALFNMSELLVFLSKQEFNIRVLDKLAPRPAEDEDSESEGESEMVDIRLRTQLHSMCKTMLNVLEEQIKQRKLATASSELEMLAVVFDPRLKNLTPSLFEGGEAGAVTAVELLKARYNAFKRNSSAAASATAAAGAAAAAGAPAPDAGGSAEPAACATGKRKRLTMTFQEERAAQRRALAAEQARAKAAAAVNAAIADEVREYLRKGLEEWEEEFDVGAFWKRMEESGEFKILPRIACQVFSVDSTSCQAERNFSTLKHLLSHLRASMRPSKVDKIMFLRCNRHLIREVATLAEATMEHVHEQEQAAQQIAQQAES